MIASRRTASSFLRLATTTTAATRRAAPAVASYCTGSNSFRPTQQTRRRQQQQQQQQRQRQQQPQRQGQPTQRQQTQRRTFFGKITAMFSGTSDDSTPADADVNVTPESLFETFGTPASEGNAVPQAMHALFEAEAVCFDVDSTVINEEGIDVLADFLGKGREVAELTAAAMEGGMKFQDALEARLELLEPSRQQILDCLEAHPLELTPGVQQLVETLHSKNVDVFLVSGGFRIMIEPVANVLGISHGNIVANTILFEDDGDGKYAGYDPDEPTSQDMGKPKALLQLQKERSYETMVMVGDGATDAQAKPPARAFVGFGGVVERAAVKNQSDWFVKDFDDMTKIVAMRQ
eukprot:CAMPEP_0168242600 /NCGR_PEP_ID=MMETSP0140_2-20121125/23539_1 /TAXON_ID=44445 /ORGANISM="Pseudo-nitzschia australis, Strain 10249 10 AB" /LENGTH=348 /DNA_ID=CAMNT_0008177777 /DNA_START=268 /DNA_END=1314 /DNA_ORIENTATION=+